MYNYQEQKPKVFSEDGQKMFLAIRDHTKTLLKSAGAADMGHLISCVTGDVWDMMACVDRLVELGEIREIDYGKCAGQHRIFIAAAR